MRIPSTKITGLSKFTRAIFTALAISALVFGSIGCGDNSDDSPTCGKVPQSTGKEGTVTVGNHCATNDDCESKACLFGPDATFGFCSFVCQSGNDCPDKMVCNSFVINATAKYCAFQHEDSCIGAGQ